MNEIDHIKEAFTQLAPTYSTTMDKELGQFWGISYANFIDRVVENAAVKPGERVLDIATGTAVIPIKLAAGHKLQGRVIGLDITPAMLQQGHQLITGNSEGNPIDLVCASAMDMPFAAGVFDVIICALGTHHMDVIRMLLEARRLLTQKGRLIISDVGATPFWRSSAGKILLKLLMLNYGLANKSARSEAELEAFQNVRTAKEWSWLLHGFGYGKIIIDEIKPRFPWFPSGLTLQAEVIL